MVSCGAGVCPHRPAPTVRPTSDRVREAVFDILFSLGGVEGLQVADLFAGTGAMGIEALSRGAASVTFVDASPGRPRHAAGESGIGGPGRGRAGWRCHRHPGRRRCRGWRPRASRYDLVLCDPPYGFDQWEALVARLPGDLAVLESERGDDPPQAGGESSNPSGMGVPS